MKQKKDKNSAIIHNTLNAVITVLIVAHISLTWAIVKKQQNHKIKPTLNSPMKNRTQLPKILEKNLKQNSRNAKTHLLLGQHYQRHNDFANALKYYKNALKLDPNNVEANLRIGQVYLKKKNSAEISLALPHFKKVLQLQAQHPKKKLISFYIKLLESNKGSREKKAPRTK